MTHTFIFPMRVYYDDTDAQGIVYHTNYVKYFERARTEWLSSLGFELDTLAEQDVLFVIRHIDVTFYKPAQLNARIEIASTLTKIDGPRLTWTQRAQAQNDPEHCFCAGTVDVVVVDEQFRPRKIPDDIKEKLTS